MKCDKSDLSSTGAISNGVIEYNGDGGWDGGRGYGGRGRARGRGRGYRGRGRGYGGGDMQQEYGGYNGNSGSGPPPAQGRLPPCNDLPPVFIEILFLLLMSIVKDKELQEWLR
ncbi:hypothetical protein Acr_11g0007650 [Actinidia rufa]|uniref:Uncharacterized protein n=1 Tax=Actinidia rufa TaxID=165716 RepID=A0A7J0FE50_9ERIC|nr:hypothetical protein Acr_11g0007650 [Actinidia rufa]